MKQTHKIAYDYAMAHIKQSAGMDQLNKALNALGSDNYVASICEPLEGAYNNLVQELLGEELYDWLMWWMYETDHGTKKMEFMIQGRAYDPTQMTLYKFLMIIDPPEEMMGS
jgi:hypothetical protein